MTGFQSWDGWWVVHSTNSFLFRVIANNYYAFKNWQIDCSSTSSAYEKTNDLNTSFKYHSTFSKTLYVNGIQVYTKENTYCDSYYNADTARWRPFPECYFVFLLHSSSITDFLCMYVHTESWLITTKFDCRRYYPR